MTVPVVRVGDEIIVGFDEPRLQQVLGLTEATEAHDAEWLASKYERIFDILEQAARQLGPGAFELVFEARRMSVRTHILHIASFAEGALAARERGSFGTDEMFAVMQRANEITNFGEVCDYVSRVRDEIAAFVRQGDTAQHDKIVTSHYGGRLSVIELLRIMLRHSAHHLRQLQWFMATELHVVPAAPLTPADLAGITTPPELFDS
jgi:hypothetical protein